MRRGFLYLVAVMDWATRKVLAWRVSNTMDVEFRLEALEEALAGYGRPEIFNSERQRATGSSVGASPGRPVHLTAVHRRAATGWGACFHGWAGTLDGQRVHRAALTQPEVRVRLSARLRDRLGASGRAGQVDRLLQCPTSPFCPGWAHARRGIWDGRDEETGGLTRTRAELILAAKLSGEWGPPHTSMEPRS